MTTLNPERSSLDDRILETLGRHTLMTGLFIFLVILSVSFFGWGAETDPIQPKAPIAPPPAVPQDAAPLATTATPAETVAPPTATSAEATASDVPPPATQTAYQPPVTLPTSRAPEYTPTSSDNDPDPTSPPMIHLLFTGDINPGRCLAQAALQSGDFEKPYANVATRLRLADLTIGSLDGSISDIAAPSPCEINYNLIGPARTVEGLSFAGFDVITVATNHAMDCGSLGWRCEGKSMQDTRQNLLAAGIEPVGIGDTLAQARAPVILERQGVRFAFLGVNAISGDATWADETTPGTAPLSNASLDGVIADILAARAKADVVIVLAHWGVEYTDMPQSDQEAWAKGMIAAGADLVIGNHPHIAQPVQVLPGQGVVAYALGNFVFDQGTVETKQGLVFEADFLGSKLFAWRLLPIRINNQFQPGWANPVEAESILDRIAVLGKDLPVP